MEIKYTLQGLLIYVTMVAYLLAFITAFTRHKKLSGFIYFAGFISAIVAFIYRGIHVEHVPMQNLFEVFVTLGMLIYPITLFSRKVLRIGGGPGDSADMLIGVIVLFPAGFVFSADPKMLPPALQCWLFAPHVAVYMLSYMIMAKSNYLAFGRILTDMKYSMRFRFLTSSLTGGLAFLTAFILTVELPEESKFSIWQILLISSAIPFVLGLLVSLVIFLLGRLVFFILQFLARVFYIKPEDMGDLLPYEDATYRMVCAGFPLLTLGLILGSWWGKLAWGDYWGWDPKELWSLASWLVYLAYFHFRVMYGKKYPRMNSLIAILGMTAIIITLLWVNLSKIFSGLHSYA